MASVYLWATRLGWLGVGIIAGGYAGLPVAAWVGGVLLALALIVGAATSGHAESEPSAQPVAERVPLSGLGTRTEQILRMAQEQAADHKAEAERRAERIVQAAHAEAQAIIAKAEREASS